MALLVLSAATTVVSTLALATTFAAPSLSGMESGVTDNRCYDTVTHFCCCCSRRPLRYAFFFRFSCGVAQDAESCALNGQCTIILGREQKDTTTSAKMSFQISAETSSFSNARKTPPTRCVRSSSGLCCIAIFTQLREVFTRHIDSMYKYLYYVCI